MLQNTSASVPGLSPLQTVAVIGAGARGRAFAFLCAQAGFQVVLEDVLSSNLRKAEEQFATEPAEARLRIRFASSVEEAVREADLAIDFVPDELESKLEIFSMLDRMAPPRTILCTPTTLSITDLASCTYRPQRCVGLQPFHDELASDVCLVQGAATATEVVATVKAFFEQLGKPAILTEDGAAGSTLIRSQL